ncbi:hypothetical protein KY285_036463 [Solanum tuberosum]|nr:hypothetical protein KY289_036670 [Solanum tuberosum]KAH0639877.1 hypothetical protein KY285_036463 [Solanum tuberosum]
MSLGFLIDVDLDDDEEEEEENAYHSSKIGTEEAENVTGQDEFSTTKDFTEHSSFTGVENVTDLAYLMKEKMLLVLKMNMLDPKKVINKMGDRDRSDVRGQVYSILESPAFELYTTEQRIKVAMILCKDDKRMELFLRMGEHDRQTMMWMAVHDKL